MLPCYRTGNETSSDLLPDRQTTHPSIAAIVSGMATDRIRKGARAHLYIDEWYAVKDMNDEKVANRLDRNRTTIFRWRTEQHRLNPQKIAELAYALDITPRQLFERPPGPEDRPSLDEMVKDAPDNVFDLVFDIAKRTVGGRQ